MAPRARKETLSSRIVADLRAAIVRGDMAPGEKINLDRLREMQGVSISPLREAMSRLIADGLVAFEDQRGYSVTPVSAENLAEITQLRVALESRALRDAIAKGDLDWESRVMGALYRLRTTPRTPQDPAIWEAAHAAFHMELLRGCTLPLLLQFCTQLRGLQDRYRALYLADLPAGRDVQAEHDAIASAACSRSADLAVSRLVAHIEATGALLRTRLLA
ncbi:GntR family transcriptional regulator [Phaeovulum sp.]|uniref:GntR family transcriptional regulator n=1 Tax=Phaeovulum sp. TaxID=2934796 RepID=UPI00356344C4